MAIEKIKILGALLELPAKQHCRFWQIRPNFEVNGLDWQCYLAGSSKRIFIFSIVLGTEYSSYVKSIATYAPIFFGYIILVLANVKNQYKFQKPQVRNIELIYEFSFLDYPHPGSYGHQNRMDDAYSRQRVPPHQPHHQDYHPQVKKFVATFYFVLTSGF